MNPKPRERADWIDAISTGKTLESIGTTYTLIVDNYHFLDAAVPTKLVIQVPFRCANAQAKYT